MSVVTLVICTIQEDASMCNGVFNPAAVTPVVMLRGGELVDVTLGNRHLDGISKGG